MDPRLETHRARSVVATGKHDLAPRRLGASKCPPAVPPCLFISISRYASLPVLSGARIFTAMA